MKNISIIFLVIVLTSCNNKKVKNDLINKYARINGRVQSIRELCYSVLTNGDELRKGSLEHQNNYVFDKQGYTLYSYHGSDSSEYHRTNKYDSLGYLISTVYRNREGSITDSVIFKNNNDGSIDSLKNYDSEGSLFRIVVYNYDKNGSDTVAKTYSATNELLYIDRYRYDKDNNLKEITVDSSGIMLSRTVNIFSSRGEKIEEQQYDRNNKIIEFHEYKYENIDKKGNHLRRVCWHNDTVSTIVETELTYYQ